MGYFHKLCFTRIVKVVWSTLLCVKKWGLVVYLNVCRKKQRQTLCLLFLLAKFVACEFSVDIGHVPKHEFFFSACVYHFPKRLLASPAVRLFG